MSKFIYTREHDRELIDLIKETGVRAEAVRRFAKKYGLNIGAVSTHLYERILTPELSQKLPRGCKAAIEFGSKKTTQPPEKSKNGLHSAPARPRKITPEEALLNIVKHKKGAPLTMEDIEDAAQRAGVHYHVAFSTLGSMVANGKTSISKELEEERAKLIKQMAIDGICALKTPDTERKLAEQISEKMGISEENALKIVLDAFHDPVYRACQIKFNDDLNEIISLRHKVRALEADLRRAQKAAKPKNFNANTGESKIEYILNLTAKTLELEEKLAITQKQLRASRKFSLTALQLLHSKNKRLNRHLYPLNGEYAAQQIQTSH